MARYRVGIATRDRIMAATRSLLGESGLEGLTLSRICEKAQITSGSFYNLFPSKDDAVLAVVREAILAVDPNPEQSKEDTVESLVEAYVRFVVDDPELSRVYLRLAFGGGLQDDDLGARVLHHHGRRADRLAAALHHEERVATLGDAVTLAEVMLATLNGLAFRWLVDPAFEFQRHALTIADRGHGPEPLPTYAEGVSKLPLLRPLSEDS